MTEAGVRDLLLEIGTEELPASELPVLREALARGLVMALAEARIERSAGAGATVAFATPRRLAVRVPGITTTQAADTVEHRGPPATAAFDVKGRPTAAAEGFARRHGVTMDALERRDTGKGEYLFYTEHRPGRPTAELLPDLVAGVLRELPARKRMRWGAPGVLFPRPVHWAVLLYGHEHVDAELLGVRTGACTHGHRFHHPEPIALAEPGQYEGLLRDPGYVIADFAARRHSIAAQVEAAGREAGGEAELDDALLDEVTSLVEWPVAMVGRFDRRFLDVPAEALVAVMKDHQRYFPVRAADGELLPAFITICNIESADPDTVRRGNERVIAPRLADAQFFWDQDRGSRLDNLRGGLDAMVFHPRLGSVADRASRIERVSADLAGPLGADPVAAGRAARLAKCDLLTQMVGEFPELQGVMGGHYARHDGEAEPVATAIAEHYRPAFAGDRIPAGPEGRALALADRLDALVGLFAIGQPPTGDKDPFALRRSALGALRILIEGGHDLDLVEALATVAAPYPPDLRAPAAVESVFDFMMDRLRVYYADQGHGHDLFEAVFARRPTRPLDFDARMRAVRALQDQPEAGALIDANKRIRNILRKAGAVRGQHDPALFREVAETELAARVDALSADVESLLAGRDYVGALSRLAELAAPLDGFFDSVMVMAEDERLRANRIALLSRARGLFLRVADLSHLQSRQW